MSACLYVCPQKLYLNLLKVDLFCSLFGGVDSVRIKRVVLDNHIFEALCQCLYFGANAAAQFIVPLFVIVIVTKVSFSNNLCFKLFQPAWQISSQLV